MTKSWKYWALVAACSAAPYRPVLAQASRWLTVANGGTARLQIDTTTIVWNPDDSATAEVWVHWKWYKLQKDKFGGSKPISFKTLDEKIAINCRSKRIATLRSYYYDADGAVVHDFIHPLREYEEPIPDTYGEEEGKGVCSRLDILIAAKMSRAVDSIRTALSDTAAGDARNAANQPLPPLTNITR